MTEQKGAYSELKMPWHYLRDGGLPDAPKQVHWVLSDLCNEDCNFCSYRVSGNPSNELFMLGAKAAAYGHDNPVRWVNTDRALALVDEMQALGVLGVQATGGGEPTVHPDHERIFEKILDSGIELSLVSNGYRWREPLFRLIPRMLWLRVSLDAGYPETYAQMRRVPESAFYRVLQNICKAALAIKDAGSPTTLGVGFTVTPDNYHQIPEGIRRAKEAGADNVRLSAMFGPDNEKPFLPIYDRVKDLIATAVAVHERHGFTIYDNFGSRLSDLVQHAPDYAFCPYQFYTTYIGGDLHVFRCCVLSYSRRGMIAKGNLTNQRFDDYWRSDARKQDFAGFDARACPRCMFNGKNRAMNYLLDPAPEHVAFP